MTPSWPILPASWSPSWLSLPSLVKLTPFGLQGSICLHTPFHLSDLLQTLTLHHSTNLYPMQSPSVHTMTLFIVLPTSTSESHPTFDFSRYTITYPCVSLPTCSSISVLHFPSRSLHLGQMREDQSSGQSQTGSNHNKSSRYIQQWLHKYQV